ncbi:predicted protein [Histoplasma capsulatum H143]|uniref:Uncharacterized protein n=1 Tax=Ajellomyces capsulatus (strain H143) TaxID=544712 RepID=C6H5V2_AJECH|nr:predicted protein [Histoplasma capsulatum H143]
MRIRWQFAGDESLGMAIIDDRNSAWYGSRPVPRMIQNQLGHLLELNMIELDRKISTGIQNMMELRKRRMWVVLTLAAFLLLHIRELDAGRNIFWSRYIDTLGFWIHPSKPKALIEEAVISCTSLLSHFHCLIGQKPLDLDWDDQKSRDMVDNDEDVVKAMKALRSLVLKLRDKNLIGREACYLYKDGDPNSFRIPPVSHNKGLSSDILSRDVE